MFSFSAHRGKIKKVFIGGNLHFVAPGKLEGMLQPEKDTATVVNHVQNGVQWRVHYNVQIDKVDFLNSNTDVPL